MTQVKYCKKCLYPSTKPDLWFKDGVCGACHAYDERKSYDWTTGSEVFKKFIQNNKKNPNYDCIIPVIGDAEDFFVVSRILELGLRPLIVCVNDYFKNDIGWHNIHQLITFFDLDSFVYNPNIHVYKELVKTSLRKSAE